MVNETLNFNAIPLCSVRWMLGKLYAIKMLSMEMFIPQGHHGVRLRTIYKNDVDVHRNSIIVIHLTRK
ncbi:hypothetical protein SUGI_0992700 [Cryptomeria japonica]|nr:hypothetical protein SUGI_0992700 [Cryptomeria japonica]